MTLDKQKKYPESELTEKIIGCAFAVYRELGYGYPEKLYQKAFEIELKKQKFKFIREKYSKIAYDNNIVGRFFLDFFIDDKIAVELKVRREIFEKDWIQLLNYLKATDCQIGLLLIFSKNGLLIKRLIN